MRLARITLVVAATMVGAWLAGSAAAQEPSAYVGHASCKSCHTAIYDSWEQTKHARTLSRLSASEKAAGCIGCHVTGTPEMIAADGVNPMFPNVQCEACHGPGKAHVEAGGDKALIKSFKSMSPVQASQTCLECHNESHPEFETGRHMKNGVGCTSCHSVHASKTKSYLLTADQPNLCFTCHTDVKADFAKPFRHRVNEKLIACSDCHNPHGTTEHAQLKMTNSLEQTCNRCHAEKSGPFVFEHTPTKADGCLSCHTPHGSSNARLLTRPTVNLLCLECHTQTPQVGGGSTKVIAPVPAGPAHAQNARYNACTVCHNQIHGSNTSSVFFR